MKTYPIIFSGPMIRALLEGRKTQTRRLTFTAARFGRRPHYNVWNNVKPGDLLWARENIYIAERPALPITEGPNGWGCRYKYQADLTPEDIALARKEKIRCTPCIHMPKWTSRLTLEVTDVRHQRLQDISEEDAIAEGATCKPDVFGYQHQFPGWSMDWPEDESRWPDVAFDSARMAFADFINELHEPRYLLKDKPSLWNENHEVAALTFKTHQQNIDDFLRARAA